MKQIPVIDTITDPQARQTRFKEINEFAQNYYSTQPEECVVLMDEAVGICREIDDIPLLVRSLRRKAYSLRDLVRLNESITVLMSAIEVSNINNLKEETAEINRELGSIYRQTENFEKARNCLTIAEGMYAELGRYEDQVIALSALANIEISQGNFPPALQYCQNAFLICEKKNIAPPAPLWHNRGSIYSSVGDMQKGLESYLRSLELSRQTGKNRYTAATLNGIGLLYWQNDELELALEYLIEATTLFTRLRYPDEKIRMLCHVAELLILLKRLDEADGYIKQALNLIHGKDFPAAMILIYKVNAVIHKQYGDLVKAEFLLDQALSISEENENFTKSIEILLEKSTFHHGSKKQNILLQALELAQFCGRKSILPEIYFALYEHYHHTGKLKSAISFYKLFHNIKQEILTEKSVMQLKVLHVQNETEKIQKESEDSKLKLKEMTIDLIQKNQVLSQIRNNTQRALLQQGLPQKKLLHGIVKIAETGASSFWMQLEERSGLMDGNLSEKVLKICPDFTTIQLRIIHLLKERMTNKEIGQLLFLTDKSIEYHRTIIRKKFNLDRTTSLTSFLAAL
ncbi:MAG: tetratricopeptide repeat protein [Bacteroidota bacterium]